MRPTQPDNAELLSQATSCAPLGSGVQDVLRVESSGAFEGRFVFAAELASIETASPPAQA